MPDKKFTVMVIKVFTGLEKKVKDLRDNFHEEIENKKEQIRVEECNNRNEKLLDGINSKLANAEHISDLEDS